MNTIKKILKWLVPLALGLFLFWLVFRKMDFSAMKDILAQGLQWPWIIAFIVLFFCPIILRALRWSQLIDGCMPGFKTNRKYAILAMFSAYGANLLFPRLGDVLRCGQMKQHDGIPFSKALGTMVTERLFDGLCLLLMALSVLVIEADVLHNFFGDNPEKAQGWMAVLLSWKLWLGIALFVLLVVLVLRYLKNKACYKKIQGVFHHVWMGMSSIGYLRQPWLFVLYTILIWLFYFLSFFVGKYFFLEPLGLDLAAMYTANVMANISTIAPVQGGIGAWHFMVIYSLGFYGVSAAQAGVFALLMHGINTIMTAITGVIAYFWMSLQPSKSSEASSETSSESTSGLV